MGDDKPPPRRVAHLRGRELRHFAQGLFDADGLALLDDLPLVRAHDGLDVQGGGHQGLHAGEPAVLPQGLQIVQHEVGVDAVPESLYFFYDLLKGKAALLQLHDLQRDLGLSAAGRLRIHNVDLLPAVFLMVQVLPQPGAVVAAA